MIQQCQTVVRGTTSDLQSTVETLIEWSQRNHMNINSKKTKELIIGPLRKENVTPLSISTITLNVSRLRLQAVGRYDQFVAEVG